MVMAIRLRIRAPYRRIRPLTAGHNVIRAIGAALLPARLTRRFGKP